MKYLIIDGCPRKGNTWKLAEYAISCIKKDDRDAEFNEIRLIKENLPFCTGCSVCFRIGHEKCPHSQITQKIIDAIDNADGVIFVSTTYNMKETSILKNLFDHFCFYLHRPYFFKSKALIITSTGGIGAKNAAKSIKSMLKGIGFNRCYMFPCSTYSWNDYKPDEKTKNKMDKTAYKFTKDIKSGKLYSPTVPELIPYNLFRGMSIKYTEGFEYATIDGKHWTDDIRKDTVYDKSVKVNFYHKIVGHMFFAIGRLAGRKVTVTYKK